MKKKMMLIFLATILSTLFWSSQVFASVGSGSVAIGATPSSGGGGCDPNWHWDTCYGYSWQQYTVTKDFPSGGVTFHYTDNTGGPVYIKGCKAGMTLYNYGFEAHGGSSYWGYQVSTQKNAQNIGLPATHYTVARGVYPGVRQTIGNYVSPAGYTDYDTARNEYYLMQKWVNEHPDQAGNFPGWDTNFRDVGAFCWWSDIDSFYSISNAKAINNRTGVNSYISTGIVGESKTANAGPLKAEVGDSVTIIFSHNLYSLSKVTDYKRWTVDREFSTSLSGGTGKSSGSTAFIEKGNTHFLANIQPYSDGENKYVLRDEYRVTFKAKGSYRFCESITFEGITTKACVTVNVGTPPTYPSCDKTVISAPASYNRSSSSSGTTSVVSRVRNASLVNSYSDFQNTVYAKPGDDINWCNAYFPGVQFAAFSEVTFYNIHTPHPDDDDELDNGKFSEYRWWTNEYNIETSRVFPSYSWSDNFADGVTTPRYKSNSASVKTGQAGEVLSETITSGAPRSVSVSNGPNTWGCHWGESCNKCGKDCVDGHYVTKSRCCDWDEKHNCTERCEYDKWICDKYECRSCYLSTCRHLNGYKQNSYDTSLASDISYVYVPYNFINTASVSLSSSMVYSGESIRIRSAKINVNQKYNGTTEGTYATEVDNAKIRLVGYVSSSSSGSEKITSGGICSALPYKNGYCDEALESYSGQTLNRNGSMSGSTDSVSFADSYNIFDANAGDYYCVVLAVYPATSGSDTNMSAAGDRSWYISKPSCSIIAKRPSFQVWGGSVYSEGAVDTLTSVAAKKNLQGESYSNKGNGVKRIFSSWVEQAVISNGFVSGLASGAAGVDYADAYGGSKQTDFCNRVPLSIANYGTLLCRTYQQTGNAGLPVLTGVQDNLMNYWGVNEGTATIRREGTYNLGSSAYYTNTTNTQGINIRYTEKDPSMSQDLTISGVTIPKGVTHVVKAKGNITIGGDISYQGGTYTSQKDVPKMIIYSDKNINIGCNVNRVDAIIIAKGWVYTCESSRQLKINGMVIAEGITFERTYGAGVGTNSGVPAEIVNYDSSAIVWGKGMSIANDFKSLKTVYQHEVAPRY